MATPAKPGEPWFVSDDTRALWEALGDLDINRLGGLTPSSQKRLFDGILEVIANKTHNCVREEED